MTPAWVGLDATRWVLIFGGLALVAAGFLLWIFPVQHSKAAPASAKCTDSKTCWVKVDDAPQLPPSSFVVFGALLSFVGINNRRITKFTGPGGIGFDTAAPQAAVEAKDKVDETAAGLSPTEKEAAKLLAEQRARARTSELERLLGRALHPAEVTDVASRAATASVNAIRANDLIQ